VIRFCFVLLLLATMWTGAAYGESPGLQACDLTVTTAIENRTPVDALRSYTANVACLYFFSRIGGAKEAAVVWHIWYHDGRQVARVPLSVRSQNWRTWSRKSIPQGAQGMWRVEVRDARSNLLGVRSFRLF
jgi:hypothetical protein